MGLGPVTSLFLILLGALIIFPVLKAKQSPGVDMVETMLPYQKGLGAFAALVGAVCLLFDLISVAELFHAPVFWLTKIASDFLLLGLGVLLGYEVIQQSVFKENKDVSAKAEEVLARLQQRKMMLGYTGIGFGIVSLVLVLFR